MPVEETYCSLVETYEATKRELSETESTIRRITGRNPGEVPNRFSGVSNYRPNTFFVSERISFPGRKRALYTEADGSPEDSSTEESSSDESPNKKPSMPSSVVAKSLQGKSRKATIKELNANSKINLRNRRMFGALIGTLEKFKSEEKKREHIVSKRVEIEKKVEAATEEERERIKKEKAALFITRREKQVRLRCLEKKIDRAESYEVFDRVHKKLCHFIQTKSEPQIFFMPASHTNATKQYFEESRKQIQALLDKKKADYDAETAEIEESYRRDSEAVCIIPSDKDNCPKDENESQDVSETDSESLAVEKQDTGLADEELTIDRHLADCLSDQEFEPIYD